MDTVLQSRSKTVVIGPDRPFVVIGERINPTGRKVFQAELQKGDLSRIEVDVAQQVAGGADMLDVNVGDPLADEVGLMAKAIPLVQSLTDLPLCIDSSVIEALEAGLAAYEGKALVNSVTGRGRAARGDPADRREVRRRGHRARERRRDPDGAAAPSRGRAEDRLGRAATTGSRPRTSSSTRWRCPSAPSRARSRCSSRRRG